MMTARRTVTTAACLVLLVPAAVLPGAAAVAAPATEWRFDFGSPTTPVADGYLPVTHTMLYDPERGYGLDRTTAVRDRGQPDPLRRDFTVAGGYEFAVDLPDGDYYVKVISGDWIAVNYTTVSVEGSPEETISAPVGEFAEWVRTVTVTDGQMNFVIGRDGRVNGIEISQLFPPTGLRLVGVTATLDPTVTLAWDGSADAAAYRVYRAPAATTEPTLVGTSTTPELTDDSGQIELGMTYVYAVSKVDGAGQESDRGEPLTVLVADPAVAPPAAPVGVTVVADEQRDAFTLRWDPVPGALAYDVYQSRLPDSSFDRVVRTEQTTHPIDGLRPSDGCCYGRHYQVVAVGEGGASAPSAVVDLVLRVEPAVVSTFDTSAAGGGARPLIGDVTGDGRPDIVMMQPHYIGSYLYKGPLVAALTAYNIEGNLLWQVGEVDPQGRNNSSDIPAQIYDIDGDGHHEVVAIMHPDGDREQEGRFHVFDGRTGELRWDFPLPDPDAHDAIGFVNLSGADTPREILLKDRYWNVWALDAHGDVLWQHATVTGHYPWPYDFTGDGRQEIMIGQDLVTADGEVLWTANLPDHVDSMWFGDLTGDGEPEIVVGAGHTVAYDWRTGAQLWRDSSRTDSQNVILGDFLPDLPGPELLGLDRIDRTANGYDGLFLMDSDGTVVWEEQRDTRGCWGSIPEMIHNWLGGYEDLILVWNRGCGEPTAVMDGSGEIISVLDSRARLWWADFCGDDRSEVLEYVQGESITIKSNGPCDLDAKVTGRPAPQPKRLHNFTRYTAGDTPRDLAAAAPVATSSELPQHPGSHANDGDAATAWQALALRPGAWWRVDLGAWHTLSGISVTFPEHPARPPWDGAGYGFGYLVEVSTDGVDWVTVVDRTDNNLVDRTQQARFTALARYVRITFTDPLGNPPTRAGLAEVHLLGTR